MNERLTVAYVAHVFPRWGGGWLHNEVTGLVRAGVDLSVFSFNRPAGETLAQPGMAELAERTTYLPRGTSWSCIRSGLSTLLRSPAGFARGIAAAFRLGGRVSRLGHVMEIFYLAEAIRQRGARHVHAQHADFVADAALAVAACLELPFSFAAHARDLYTSPGRLKLKIGAATFVATCTSYNETYLKQMCAAAREEGVAPGKIARVYHGVDLERFSFTRGSVSPERLISVTRLKEKKGFSYLLEAMAKLKVRGRDVRLEIYGDGDQKEAILERIANLGIQDRVELKGAIEHHRIPGALRSAGIFVLPCVVTADQDRDGIPNTIIEAMATGVPVISTSISGIPEAVRDGQSGLLVPERDAERLAGAIERMIADDDLRERCAREGRRIAESCFSIEATGRALAALLRSGAVSTEAAARTVPEPAGR